MKSVFELMAGIKSMCAGVQSSLIGTLIIYIKSTVSKKDGVSDEITCLNLITYGWGQLLRS